MKKTFSVVVGLFMLLILPAVSFSAGPGWYVSGQLGLAFLTDSDISGWSERGTLEFDTGFATGFAGGYNFGMFRVEGEIEYQYNDIDKVRGEGYGGGDVTALSSLANGYYDFVNKSPFTPFITAGIGVARIEANDVGGDADDMVFAYQVGFGVAYAINKNMSIDLKYRYFATEDPNFDGVDAEFASHNIYGGFRYNF